MNVIFCFYKYIIGISGILGLLEVMVNHYSGRFF